MERGAKRRVVRALQGLVPVVVIAFFYSCGSDHCRLDLTPDSGTTGSQVSLRACLVCGKKNPEAETGERINFTSEPDCPCGESPCSLCAPSNPETNADGCVDASLSLTDPNVNELQVTVHVDGKDGSGDSAAYVLSNGTPAPTSTPVGTGTPTPPTPTGTPAASPTPTQCAMRGASCAAMPCCGGQGTCQPGLNICL